MLGHQLYTGMAFVFYWGYAVEFYFWVLQEDMPLYEWKVVAGAIEAVKENNNMFAFRILSLYQILLREVVVAFVKGLNWIHFFVQEHILND